MKFAKVFPLLIAKAERKGRTRDEVFEVTKWLFGYTKDVAPRTVVGGVPAKFIKKL